jgi:sphinganine-1-phosphate aldolase
MKIPALGLSEAAVMAALETYGENDLPWREGGTFAYVYEGGRDVEAVVKQAYMRYLTENALDPTVYPSLLRFENEIVSMAINHLRGDEACVGNFTSGGTESCMLAVKAARDYARSERGIAEPEIILPVTAHACFQKAAHYFDMKMHLVPVDPETWKVRPEDMAVAINANTILMVGSACQYAHGVIDPIGELGALALERNLLLHVLTFLTLIYRLPVSHQCRWIFTNMAMPPRARVWFFTDQRNCGDTKFLPQQLGLAIQ